MTVLLSKFFIQTCIEVLFILCSHANLNITSTFKILNSTINNSNLSLNNAIKLVNDKVVDTNISMQNVMSFINSTLKNVNFNLTNRFIFTNELLNNTRFNITNKIGIVNDTLNNVNVNLTSKINFIHSLLTDTNFNITTKIGFVNTTLNNVNFNLTTKINFVDSLINLTQSNEYPITLTGVPNGTGMYQQLITIKDPKNYGINANGSNIGFYDGSNNTHLYAWIQSINNTSMQVWVKNYNGSSVIDMQILPSFDNVFSANGYLGEAPQLSPVYAEYDNGVNVFPIYFNGDTSTSKFSTANGSLDLTQTTSIFSNGATINVLKYETTTTERATLALIYTGSSVGSGYWIAESSFASDGSATDLGVAGLGQNSGSGTSDNLIQVDTQYGGTYFAESYVLNSSLVSDKNQQGTTTTSWRYGVVYDNSSSSYYGYIAPQPDSPSGGYSGTVSVNPVSSISPLYFAVNPVDGSGGKWVEFNWVLVRTYLSTMPTFIIGKGTPPSAALFNINTILNFMNTVLNNVNFNVSTKIQFLQSELNDTNLNITTKIKYVDSLVNNTTNNIILQLAIENTTLNNVNLNITTKIKFAVVQ